MTDAWIILGASSSMARAFARLMAERGAALALAARDLDDAARDAADLGLRGAASAQVFAYDTRKPETLDPIVAWAEAHEGPVNVAVFAGSMPPQAEVEADPSLLAGVVADNYAATAAALLRLAPIQAERGKGAVVGVGSVAGDRGRLGNYVYGSAKAGFHAFLSGHRNRMGRQGVHVMTVKPGFVDTAMTWGLEGMFLVASPERVAHDIARGLERRRSVVYTPIFWLGIMTIIRTIPEWIFKKMKI